jgi:hypothetical protein
MDNLTACEMAEVQNRWSETGSPTLGYLGATPGWLAKGLYAVTGDTSWFGSDPEAAKKEAQKVDATINAVIKVPQSLPVPGSATQAKTEEKAVDDKKKQDVTDKAQDQATAPTNPVDCAKRGGVWNKDLSICRSKSFFESEDTRKYAPWVALGVVSLGLFVMFLRRR